MERGAPTQRLGAVLEGGAVNPVKSIPDPGPKKLLHRPRKTLFRLYEREMNPVFVRVAQGERDVQVILSGWADGDFDPMETSDSAPLPVTGQVLPDGQVEFGRTEFLVRR